MRLLAQLLVMLIRDGIDECRDATLFVVDAKISSSDDRPRFAVALVQLREDSNEVPRFLRVRRNEHLVLEELHQVRCEGPPFNELLATTRVFTRRHVHEAQEF